jgi:hypothetical protein
MGQDATSALDNVLMILRRAIYEHVQMSLYTMGICAMVLRLFEQYLRLQRLQRPRKVSQVVGVFREVSKKLLHLPMGDLPSPAEPELQPTPSHLRGSCLQQIYMKNAR